MVAALVFILPPLVSVAPLRLDTGVNVNVLPVVNLLIPYQRGMLSLSNFILNVVLPLFESIPPIC